MAVNPPPPEGAPRSPLMWLAAGLTIAAFILALLGLPILRAEPATLSPLASPPAGQARAAEGGQVTVTLTPQGGTRFSVAMETHSVDLDGYDLAKLTLLADGRGNRVPPASWEKTGSGHHIQGTLTFPAAGAQGSLDLKGPVTITIASVAGVDRAFRWEKGVAG